MTRRLLVLLTIAAAITQGGASIHAHDETPHPVTLEAAGDCGGAPDGVFCSACKLGNPKHPGALARLRVEGQPRTLRHAPAPAEALPEGAASGLPEPRAPPARV